MSDDFHQSTIRIIVDRKPIGTMGTFELLSISSYSGDEESTLNLSIRVRREEGAITLDSQASIDLGRTEVTDLIDALTDWLEDNP